jgi:hypothetical protein
MSDLSGLSNEQLMQLYNAPQPRPLSEWSNEELKAAASGRETPAMDVLKSAASGVGSFATGMAGLPGAAQAGVRAGMDYLFPPSEKQMEARNAAPNLLPTPGQVQSTVEGVTGPFYKPQSTLGEYTKTGAEFMSGAALGGGGIPALLRYGLAPGVASEAAGQATKGSGFEPVARVAGALAGGGVGALTARPGSAAQSVRQQLPDGVTPQMVTQAEALIADAGRAGVTLSWPEALSQVAGRPVLSNAMRHLEAAPATEARMAAYYGERPQQIDNAARNTFDNIAPPNAAPSTIGPEVATAANSALGDVRQAINTAARPHYDAASTIRLTPEEMARVRALPGYEEARAAVRNDPQLNRYVSQLPDDSVGFLNEVKKHLDTQSQNAASRFAQNRNQQRAAGYGSDAGSVRNELTNAYFGNPARNYETALNIESTGRQNFLEPLMQGPLGKLAQRDATTQRAIQALFPQNPVANSQQEVATAVQAIVARNPRAARDLVRAHAETTFNEATQALQSGANQMGGAKFASVIAGNAQQRANLEAAVTALPSGSQIWAGFNRFLEIAQATGTRQNIGSKTAYNAEYLKNTASSGLVGEAAKGAANPITRGFQFLADRYERWTLGRNLNQLADILTNPAAGNQLRVIAASPVNSERARAAAIRLANMMRAATSEPINGAR